MLEAEESVLGTILLDNNKIHSVPFLTPSDFSVVTYQKIYASMLFLSAENKPIDAVTLTSVGIESAVVIRLMEGVASAANAEHYGRLVKEASQKRQLIRASVEIEALGMSDAPAESSVLEAEKIILNIRGVETVGRARSLAELGTELYALVEQRMNDGSGFFGHKTGFSRLDNLLGGLQDGETLVLAGRPSMGKSSIATQILLNRALEGAKSLFFSLEMSHHMCGLRMMSQLSGLSMNRIKNGKLNAEEMLGLKTVQERLCDMKIWVDDTGSITVPQIRSTCRRIAADAKGLDLVMVDYLQLCGSVGREGREQQVAEASKGLKAISKEFGIPVIVLSQLNRSCELREDKRPMLSDLRESGAIEQDADAVVMAYRPHVYNSEADQSELELIIRKQRNGPLGTAVVKWHPESMAVRDF